MDKFSVILVCAGTASRMEGIDKQLFLLNGKPVFLHSVDKFNKINSVQDIIIVAGSHNIDDIKKYCSQYKFDKPIKFTLGGSTRQQSVLNGIALCDKSSNYIAIHDGARPLVSINDITNVFDNAIKYSASTLGVPVKDTIKQISSDNFIDFTPPRELLYQIQTPQVFNKKLYLKGIDFAKENSKDFTDDCQLIEAIGHKVYVTKGSYSNIKITTPDDIGIANSILQNKGEN